MLCLAVLSVVSGALGEEPEKPWVGTKIPLRLDLPVGVREATDWPVTFGVAFPIDRLKDVRTLRIVDSHDRKVPSQMEVTGRWATGRGIQWVRFDALLSSKEKYAVEVGAVESQSSPPEAVSVAQREGKIIVDTGVATYTLGRGASPIEEIRLGGKLVATSEDAHGLYVIDQEDREGTASTARDEMQIEASGPIVSCVRFEGDYVASEGEVLAHYVVRIENWAGQPFARVTHTLVLTQETSKTWLKEVGWEFSMAAADRPKAWFNTSREKSDVIREEELSRSAPTAFMLQDRHYRFGGGENHFVVATENFVGNTTKTVEGKECGDWACLHGRNGMLMLFCRDAARQHPKEFVFQRGQAALRLFSSRSGEEMDFRTKSLLQRWKLPAWCQAVSPSADPAGLQKKLQQLSKYESNAIGWAKTHEIVIAPYKPSTSMEVPARMARLHSQPVYAVVDPAWLCRSGVFGPIHPKDPEAFPVEERAVDATVKVWQGRVADWGDYGFVDYAMGPHAAYLGKNATLEKYNELYTMRPDLWLLYARSGERTLRDFAQTTNRGQMDGRMAHWAGPNKTKGLFLTVADEAAKTGFPLDGLPFYWENATGLHTGAACSLNGYLWDYHLTGYRRAKDVVMEYIAGAKSIWSLDRIAADNRPLMAMRMLIQAYNFTGDPALRRMALTALDVVDRPDAELGVLPQPAPAENEEVIARRDTDVDVRAAIEAYQAFGEQRYYDVAHKLSRYWWERLFGDWPLCHGNPQGVIGGFLFDEKKDPRYPQGLAIQMRKAASGWATSEPFHFKSAEEATFLFEGIPYAEDVILRANAEKTMASWASFEDFGYPCSVVVQNTGGGPLRFDVWPSRGLRVIRVGKADHTTSDLPWIVKGSYQNQSIEIPPFTSDRAFHILPAMSGMQTVVANRKTPMVIYAPEYWRPVLGEPFGVHYYFRLPPNSESPQIVLEGSAKLFDPKGKPWQDGKPLHGVVDLPIEQPGLWSFVPVDNQLVHVRNLPPFFAVENAENYFEPPIAWRREKIPATVKPPKQTTFVDGAIATPGNRALYVCQPAFRFATGTEHPSGDGNLFMPRKQGTIEFWYRPSWSSIDMPQGKKPLCSLLTATEKTYGLWYAMAPRHPDPAADFMTSHVLCGEMMSDGESKQCPLQAWRRTLFMADRWVHIAWVWGQHESAVANKDGVLTPRTEMLTMEIFVNGRKGQWRTDPRWRNLPMEMPQQFFMRDADAAIDELRISDVRRYTRDFVPPVRDAEFSLDEHTRALFHFNGDLNGESYGVKEPISASIGSKEP
jgi:hypothetical protein